MISVFFGAVLCGRELAAQRQGGACHIGLYVTLNLKDMKVFDGVVFCE